MSTAALRHHFNTFAFLPRLREERVARGLRTLKIRTSRRRLKQVLRQLVSCRTV